MFFVFGWKKIWKHFFCFWLFLLLVFVVFGFFCFWLKVAKAHKSGLARKKMEQTWLRAAPCLSTHRYVETSVEKKTSGAPSRIQCNYSGFFAANPRAAPGGTSRKERERSATGTWPGSTSSSRPAPPGTPCAPRRRALREKRKHVLKEILTSETRFC